MSALILLTCFISGSDCRATMAADNLPIMECLVRSQQIAAQYINDNPNRVIVRAICANRSELDKYLGRGAA